MKLLLFLLALLSAPLVRTASAYDAVLTDDTSLALTGKVTKAWKLPMLVVDAKHRALFKFDLSTFYVCH